MQESPSGHTQTYERIQTALSVVLCAILGVSWFRTMVQNVVFCSTLHQLRSRFRDLQYIQSEMKSMAVDLSHVRSLIGDLHKFGTFGLSTAFVEIKKKN